MKVGIGLSTQLDIQEAVQECWYQASTDFRVIPPDWILVFFTQSHSAQADVLRKSLIQASGCTQLVGCSASRLLTSYQEIRDRPALLIAAGSSSSEKETAAFGFQQILADGPSTSQQLREWLEALNHSEPLLLVFSEALQNPYNLLNMLRYMASIPKTFGIGVNHSSQQKSVQLGPEQACHRGISGIAWKKNRYQVGIAHTCTPIGDPLFITSCLGNAIATLDHAPALELFTSLATQQGFPNLETAAQHLLLGFALDSNNPSFAPESCIIRSLSGVDVSQQALTVSHIIQEKIFSFFIKTPTTTQENLQQMLQSLKDSLSRAPSFGIYFTGDDPGTTVSENTTTESKTIRKIFGDLPWIGVSGAYEIFTHLHGTHIHSFSRIFILFE